VVLDTLAFAAIAGLRDAFNIANVHNAAATRLPNGKLRAVVSAHDRWAVWTQGQSPRMLRNPYIGDPPIPAFDIFNKMSISPDGSRLLVTRSTCDGGYEDPPPDRGGHWGMPSRCKPVESVIAALHDLSTGRALWTIRAIIQQPNSSITPAISDDGRYAFIAFPYNGGHSQIALVSMDDGRTVQTVRSPAQGSIHSIGFLQGGRGVWVHSEGMTALYDLRDRAQ
jgi:hypothetical protein